MGRHPKAEIKEALFLAFYYGEGSKSKGNAVQSMIRAGYEEKTANTGLPQKIIRRFGDLSFAASAKAVGITKPFLAIKLKQILDLSAEEHPKEVLAGARLALASFGEATEEGGKPAGNIFNAPVMIIQGATPEKLKALKGALPQLTEAERREQAEQADWERYRALPDRGALNFELSSDRNKRLKRAKEAAVPDFDAGDALEHTETGAQEGGHSARAGAGDAEVSVDVPAAGD